MNVNSFHSDIHNPVFFFLSYFCHIKCHIYIYVFERNLYSKQLTLHSKQTCYQSRHFLGF